MGRVSLDHIAAELSALEVPQQPLRNAAVLSPIGGPQPPAHCVHIRLLSPRIAYLNVAAAWLFAAVAAQGIFGQAEHSVVGLYPSR